MGWRTCAWCGHDPDRGCGCACPDGAVRREFYRGDAYQFMIVVQQVLAVAPAGTPEFLVPGGIAGWNFWCTAKYHEGDPDPLAAFQLGTETTGASIYNALLCQVLFTVPPAATQGFPARPVVLRYDVKAFDAGGNPATIEHGFFRVLPQLTRKTA